MPSAIYDYIVPGLDVLIGDPDILRPKKDDEQYAETFYIPRNYIYQVDRFYGEQTSRGDACCELTKIFGDYLTAINNSDQKSLRLKNGTCIEFVDINCQLFDSNLSDKSAKNQAIAATKTIWEHHPTYKNNLAIMTGADQLAMLAASNDVNVTMLNPEVYTGRREVTLPLEHSNLWYSNHRITREQWAEFFPEEKPLRINEFVEFISEDFGQTNYGFVNIGRFDPKEDALVPLKHTKFKKSSFNKIRPRSAGQAMLLEALLISPEEVPLVVVSGIYGTGKTFLALAAGYYGVVEESNYERIFICPRDGALGKEVGFLPGDSTEKTLPKARAITDNLREILRLITPDAPNDKFDKTAKLYAQRNCLDRRTDEAIEKFFEFEPIIHMDGRSIKNNFIIFDEFQNMERYQAKELLPRTGDNSKTVVCGDPTQRINPHINLTSNGLSYSASRLAGQPEAIVVTLTEDEIRRSMAAQVIARCFS